MSGATGILEELRRRQVRVCVKADQLLCYIPAGGSIVDLRSTIRKYKPELMRLVSQTETS